MTQNAGGGRGAADGLDFDRVLASSVPRDAVDEAIAATGKQAKRSHGRLPPHVMVYFAMAMALFAEEDYEEVAARLTETLTSWGRRDSQWAVPTSGGITQARQRPGRTGQAPVRPGRGFGRRQVAPRWVVGSVAVDGDPRHSMRSPHSG